MADATGSREAAYPTLDAWSHARIITVDLGDVGCVDYQVPDLDAYIARGLIPNPLLPMAISVAGAVKAPNESTMSQEDRAAYFDLRCHIIATHLKKPDLVAALGLEGAVAWVAGEMPPGHRDTLWAHSVHFLVADEVMQAIRSLIPFRDGQSGDQPADSGGADGSGT